MRHFGKSDAQCALQTNHDIVARELGADSSFPTNFTQAKRFLEVLNAGRSVTFQTFSDREELKQANTGGKMYDPNARFLHGTLAEHKHTLARLNSHGAGIHVMVNEGDGGGRSTAHVVSVRALFADFDGTPLPDKFPLKPHLIVASSPGRYHVYWLANSLERADFSPLQEALAAHYNTDRAITDLPRVMRLPGFLHQKAKPIMVNLLQALDLPPYTPANIYDAWPFLVDRIKNERAHKVTEVQRRNEALKRAAERRTSLGTDEHASAQRLLEAHHDTVAGAAEGTRHETLKKAAFTLGGYIGSGYLEPLEVEDVLRGAAVLCGLHKGEADAVILWGLAVGALKPLELACRFPNKLEPLNKASKRTRLAAWYR